MLPAGVGVRVDADLRVDDNAPPGFTATAFFNSLHRQIHILMAGEHQVVRLFGHESIHALRQLGYLTTEEWSTLDAAARKGDWIKKHKIQERYPELFRHDGSFVDQAMEEAVAEEFGHWLMNRHRTRGMRAADRLFHKIRKFFLELARALRIIGYDTTDATQIFADIAYGRMKQRRARGDVRANTRSFAKDEGPIVEFENEESETSWQESWMKKEQLDQQKESLKSHVARRAFRQYEHLPETGEYADLIMKLRPVQESSHNAGETVTRLMEKVVKGLNDRELDLLSRAIYIPDLLWTNSQGMKTPFKFDSKAQLEREDAKIKEALKAHPEVVKRLKLRNKFMDELRVNLVKHGVLDPAQVRNKHFVHHQVMEYAQMRGVSGVNSSKIVSPIYSKRRGSEKDIVSNYVMVEMEYLFKALNDIETAQFLGWLDGSKYNHMQEFTQRATRENASHLTDAIRAEVLTALEREGYADPATINAVKAASTANKIAKIVAADKKESEDVGRAYETMDLLRQYDDFRRNIALSMKSLRALVLDWGPNIQALVPEHIEDAHRAFIYQAMGLEIILKDSPMTGLWRFIDWLSKENSLPEEQSAAVALLATLGQRRSWISTEAIPNDYVNPRSSRQLIEKYAEGTGKSLSAWQADAKVGGERAVHLFTAYSVPQRMMEAMLDRIEADAKMGYLDKGDNKAVSRRLAAMIRADHEERAEILTLPKREMILEENVALALNEFRDRIAEGQIEQSVIAVTSFVKRNLLFQPHRWPGYFMENNWGDIGALLATRHGAKIVRGICRRRRVKSMARRSMGMTRRPCFAWRNDTARPRAG